MSTTVFEMQAPKTKYRMVEELHEEPSMEPINTTPDKHINWRCPSLMYGSLLAGLALGIGHYGFYAGLNGVLVSSTISQTWVNRIGTAFAFLVKLFFVIAAGTAYIQRQWLVMGSTVFKIGQIDSMTGVLSNVFNLFDGLFWLRHPVLAGMATITWLLPLAAVVSPGAITVNSTAHINTTNAYVPQLSYGNYTNFANVALQGTFAYQRPEPLLSRIAFATATTSQILSRNTPFENNTYTLNFTAPALRCNVANSSLSFSVQNNTYYLEKGVGQTWDFIAWVGGDDHGIGSSNVSAWNSDSVYTSLDMVSNDTARLFASALNYKPNATGVPPRTTFECQLWNALYHVQFTTTSRSQYTDVLSMQYLNGVPVAGLDGQDSTLPSEWGKLCYQSVMDAFGRLLVGYVFHDRHGFLLDNLYMSSTTLLTTVDWYDNTTIPRSMETLFQNITMSLFNADSLLKTSTEAGLTPIDVTTYPLIYVFKPRDLVLAYSISLFITLLCTLLGTHAIFANRACYRNMFSTFVRTTRHSELAVLVNPMDSGADPIPQGLKNAKIAMDSSMRRRG